MQVETHINGHNVTETHTHTRMVQQTHVSLTHSLLPLWFKHTHSHSLTTEGLHWK